MDKIEEAAKPLGFNVRKQNYKVFYYRSSLFAYVFCQDWIYKPADYF